MGAEILISVIVSTYNRPDALYLVLQALLDQTDKHFEVIVADDGSAQETSDVVNYFKSSTTISIHHVWQPDEGFRLAAIRNKAVKEANGDYYIFLDGDSVPPPYWITRHRRLMEKGWMVIGQRVLTEKSFSESLLQSPEKMRAFDWSVCNFYRLVKEQKVNRLWPAFNFPLGPLRKCWSSQWKKVRGCNWAIWKDDYWAVNGSDETIIGWGSEDSDLAVRLLNNGVLIKTGIFATGILHLWHIQAPKNHSEENYCIVKQRNLEGIRFPRKGLIDLENS